MSKVNLKVQLENFEKEIIIDSNGGVNDCFNFYDWFCKDSSLKNKSVNLFKKLNQISKSAKFDLEKTYCFFKNNYSIATGLYDDFRICDIESGDVIYTVIPSFRGNAQIWGKENGFNGPILKGSWKEVKNFFLN